MRNPKYERQESYVHRISTKKGILKYTQNIPRKTDPVHLIPPFMDRYRIEILPPPRTYKQDEIVGGIIACHGSIEMEFYSAFNVYI